MPTRICPATGSFSSPDLTAIPARLTSSTVWLTDDTIGSDHLPIILTVEAVKVTPKRETKWSFKKAKWDVFVTTLDAHISNMEKSEKVNAAAENLNSAVLKALHAAVPRGCRTTAHFWWNDEVDNAVSARRQALKDMQRNNTDHLRHQYQLACDEASRVITQTKREAWRNYCDGLNDSTSTTKVWRTVASLNGKCGPPKTADSLILNGKTYHTEKEKATAFNSHQTRSQHHHEQSITEVERQQARTASRNTLRKARLKLRYLNACQSTSVLSLEGRKMDVRILKDDGTSQWYRGVLIQHLLQQGSSGTVLVQWANGDPDELLNLDKEEWNMVDENDDERSEYDSDFSMSEVKHVLQSMAFSKAGGADGVPMQVLQHLKDSAIQELTRIINMSWTSGMCPLLWKSSRLVPIPKSKPGAYRPISLTNAFARVADRLVTRRLTHFLERFQAIPGEQAGFRTAMSAEMQCCSFVEWISQRQQNGDSVNCVFLDASAVYDNVHHDILMARLGALDRPARLTKWINSFIRCREVDTKGGLQ